MPKLNKVFKIVVCIATILMLPFSAQAQEKDDWMLTALTVELIIDCLQTNYIYDNSDKFHEENLVLRHGMKQYGKIFIPLYFGSYYLTAKTVAKSNFKYKKAVLGLMITDESRFILQNSKIDIGLSFKLYF